MVASKWEQQASIGSKQALAANKWWQHQLVAASTWRLQASGGSKQAVASSKRLYNAIRVSKQGVEANKKWQQVSGWSKEVVTAIKW